MNWMLYIVENKYAQLYTGICKDLSRRFKEHCDGGKRSAKALKGKGPLKLKFAAQVDDHSSALKSELWVKKLNKKQKLALIQGQLELQTSHKIVDPKSLAKINEYVP